MKTLECWFNDPEPSEGRPQCSALVAFFEESPSAALSRIYYNNLALRLRHEG